MSEREAITEPSVDDEEARDAVASTDGQTWLQSLFLGGVCLASGAVAGRISTLLSTVVIGLGINLISQVVAQLNFSRAQQRARLTERVASLDPGVGTTVDLESPMPVRVRQSRTRQLIALALIAMTVLGLLLGRASESGGFGLDTSSSTTVTTFGSGSTSVPGSSSSTTSSTTPTTVVAENDVVEIIAPETMKVGHQNELFTKVPPGAQTEYVFQGQRYPAVVKDFWIRPEEPGTYSLQVIVTDNEGELLFDESVEFDAVQAPLSERTCNRFLRSEISDIVGLDILLNSSFSSLGLNSCIWQVPDQPTQALSMAIHEGGSSDAMVAWLQTTTAMTAEVAGAERAWTFTEDGTVRLLAVNGTSFVDLAVGEPLPVDDAMATASAVAAFGLQRVVSGEQPAAVACRLFTADEISLVAQVQVVQQPPEIPTACRYSGTAAQVDISAVDGPSDLEAIAEATGLDSVSTAEETIGGYPALVLSIDGGFATAIGVSTETMSLTVTVVRVLDGTDQQKSSEVIARELMLAALERS